MSENMIQLSVFAFVTAIIGLLTYMKCRGANRQQSTQNKEYFLAGGGLSWVFVAGSITLTNLSTDQLVGMNGNQMALLAWWEFSAVIGLIILAKLFLPVYYKYNCTTTTELLEKRYNNKHIRAVIGAIFFLGNAFIYMPAVIYSGALFMQTMFNVDIPLMYIAVAFATLGAVYAFFGGLRAVAVSDTYSGVLLLGMAIFVVFLALNAINYDFSDIPAERLTFIGDNDSPLPWHTLLTGMIFIQMFYWGTNQTITQRAMAAPTLKEAQKGVFAAAGIRILIVPAIVVIPGIVSYKLYGDIGDAAYGRIVGDLMPTWLTGVFAAAMAAAVLSTYNSLLNSATALYVCDIHEAYIKKDPNVVRLSGWVTLLLSILTLTLVPIYQQAESIINLLQQLNGLLSMPILSIFIVGLVFKNIDARAGIGAVIFGVLLYASLTFEFSPFYSSWHYIHLMPVTLAACVSFALLTNRFVFGKKIQFASRDDLEVA
ncbi:SLC5 family protein [Shewanella ulleungensis]|jgi:SSS family solute:Na+ symporter|uniref:Solute:sodium symporter family transporter n=1 Tax=Shewanella ulleungensis TaxID=2282699 RepID=A0ABQ2QV94_9GAMM|nr:SLC5 family protein [Shewanella ulleungensis]MCL1151920.1 SLC5 family protein [Shewanella ulleungensis]GGP97969.1 solute:sodium symporter family transporter [Shewanella ulleungensis]